MHDLRYAVRMLLKSPGFSLVAVLALALGIGANTAIFTVISSILLRPLPYPNSDRIVFLERKWQAGRSPSISLPRFDYWRKNTRSFESYATADIMGGGYNLGGEEPERLRGIRVSADFFKVIGIPPALGRAFTAEDDRPNTAKSVILTHGLWQRRFGGDPSVLGRVLTISGEPATVIGVMPASFKAFPEADVWLPLQAVIKPDDQANYLFALARLRPEVSLQQARAEMATVAERFRQDHKELMPEGESATATPLHEQLVGDVRSALLILLAAVGAVLLIACANVANLLLARAAERTREVAIRISLGAARGRLIRQLLTESVILALAGGALGLLFGYWGVKLLEAFSPAKVPLVDVTLDWRVLGFTLGLSLLTGLLFGLVPALHAVRPNLTETLKEGSRGATTGAGRSRTRSVLVAGEIAITLVLVICAGLLTATFIRLRTVKPGFDARNVVTLQMSLVGPRFETTAQVDLFQRQVAQRLEALPGVQAAGCATNLPLELGPDMPFGKEGEQGTATHSAYWRPVTPGYFPAMGIQLRGGRLLSDTDTGAAPPVVLINETAARVYFKNEQPLGRRITIGKGLGPMYEDRPREIVGIVADVREAGLNQDPPPIIYVPQSQVADIVIGLINRVMPATWVIRTAGEPMSFVPAIRAAIRAVERENPISNIRTMEQVMAESVQRQNFNMVLLGTFALLALVLAAVGIYGVMAYSVNQRTHEIGIRMALGAPRRQIVRMVVGQGMILAGTGIAAGLVIAYFATRLLVGLLYGVDPNHPPTFGGVAALLALVALIASYVPARRATRVDPLVALRYE